MERRFEQIEDETRLDSRLFTQNMTDKSTSKAHTKKSYRLFIDRFAVDRRGVVEGKPSGAGTIARRRAARFI